ncbi:hypothetical protein ACHWQZ_G004798 [Mnemiopsis leidyi]
MLEREEIISKRPDDGAFYQQRLPAWKPIINIHTTVPVFGVLGIFLVPIGLLLITTAGSVKEVRLDYSNCSECSTNFNIYTDDCTCSVDFTLDTKFSGNQIMMYYGLERYYQNHRKYATSRSDYQLRGNPLNPDSNCEPYESDLDTNQVFAPCGLIANSMFNDTFELEWVSQTHKNGTETTKRKEIKFTQEGIAWTSDHGTKFKNPAGNDLVSGFNGTVKPPSWSVAPYELDPENPSNNGFLNEPFIVWMRVAAFPTFRKLYGRILMDENPELDNGLERGRYTLHVKYRYPVLFYQSKKFFVLSTTSIFGAKNLMIGIVYLVVGALLLLLSISFAFIAKKELHSFMGQ